jgi:hypothetical protein
MRSPSTGKAQEPEDLEESECVKNPARARRKSLKLQAAESDNDAVQKQQKKSPTARKKGKRKAADLDSDKQKKSPAARMKGKHAVAAASASAAAAADSDDAEASDSDADEPRNGKRAAASDSDNSEACDADADEAMDWGRIFVTRGRSSLKKKEFKLPRSRCGLALGPFPRDADAAQFCVPIEFINERLGATMPEPQYKKLRANAYPDPAMRGIVPASECQPCSCDPGSECGDGCINRCLYQECLPGNCPSLAGSSSSSSKGSSSKGRKYCANAAIQEKRYPPSEIFRTMDGRGWGLRLCESSGSVQPGTLLKEYMGEVITMDEVRV